MLSPNSAIDAEIEVLRLKSQELEIRQAELVQNAEELEREGCRRSLAEIANSIASLQNRQAPISRLPDDLLVLVFEAGPRGDVEGEILPMPFPVLVSHVSAHWRTVALGDPFLWVAIDMCTLGKNPLHSLYLERSKSCPLDICLYVEKKWNHSSAFNLSMLTPHRCQELTIDFQRYESARRFLPLLRTAAMPLLTSLTLWCLESSTKCENRFLPTRPTKIFSKAAPLLTELYLVGISPRFCIPPLGCLTDLCLDPGLYGVRLSYKMFILVLSHVANTLKNLILKGNVCSFTGVDHKDDAGIELPVLESLFIESRRIYENEDSVEHISKCIRTPSLKNLILVEMTSPQFSCALDILTIPRAVPGTGIQSLCLIEVEVEEEEHLFMERCPNIKELILRDNIRTVLDFILESDDETIDSGQQPLWPYLRSIQLDDCDNGCYAGYQECELWDVLQSRADISCPLTISIDGTPLR